MTAVSVRKINYSLLASKTSFPPWEQWNYNNFMDFLLIIPLFAGIASGLAINYISDVLPLTRSFSQPACLVCGAPLNTWDYLLMRACASGHRRNTRTWVVLVLALIISFYIWFSPPEKIGYGLGLILSTYFGVIFVIDLEHRLILHPTSIFGAAFGLMIGIIKRGIAPTLYGGLAGLVIMLFFYFLGVLFARVRTRRMLAAGQEADDEEALGAGDVILVTILGLILGWPVIWFGLLTGILLGGFVSLCMIFWLLISGRYSKNILMTFIPYGPYFVTSAFVIVFFPDMISKLLAG
jgi:prepilin signal peptidase PulO-like enzyme (type II secretory pathway)